MLMHHLHTHLHFSIINPLMCMCFGSGKKPENLSETHMNSGRACETSHKTPAAMRLQPTNVGL